MTDAQTQLVLALARRPAFKLDEFVGKANGEITARLRGLDEPQRLWIVAAEGCGKSHLLLATAQHHVQAGHRAAYICVRDAGPEIVEGVTDFDCVCVDDVGVAAGDARWEQALMALHEAHRQRVVIYGDRLPPHLAAWRLADLRSRLVACETFRVEAPSDEELALLLRRNAERRGLVLNDDVLNYLLNRAARAPGDLVNWLERFDAAAWRERKPLTLPFVRRLMS